MLLRKTTFLTLFGICLAFLAHAGTIKGKIRDSKTGEPMTGATVTLEPSHLTTTVQLDGTFSFRHLPAGKYRVIASTIGYLTSQPMDIVLESENDEKAISLDLAPSSTLLEEVQVSALSGGSDRTARRIEQRSDMIQNILSARTIEISPDVTVANALQRVSGVVIQRDNTGEGRYAIIRGMDQRYNNTLVNGVKIPSPDDKYRFVPMDIFPSDMVERLEVIKALTPNMEGDAIGGSMNLVMKDAPDHFIFSAHAAGGYNTIFNDRPFTGFSHSGVSKQSPAEVHGNSYSANPATDFPLDIFNYTNSHPINSQLGLTIGDRFLQKKLGVTLSASFQNFYKGSTWDRLVPDAQPQPSPIANTVSFSDSYVRQYSTATSRLGLQNKIDYVFDQHNKISLFNLFLHQTDEEMRYTPDSIVGLNSSATQAAVTREYRSTWQIQNIYNATLQGIHQLSRKVRLDWSGVYSIAQKETPDQSWYNVGATVYRSNGKNTSETDSVPTGKGFMTAIWQHNKDQDLAGYANLSYIPTLFRHDIEFTMGGLYRYKTRDNYYADYPLQNTSSNPVYFSPSLYPNTYPNPSTVPLGFSPADDATGAIASQTANFYTAHEKIAAGYIMAKFMLMPALQVLGGVRVENTQQDYNTALSLEANYAYGSIHYTDVLPSAHLKYLLSANQNLRLSYFKSISRPGFGDFVPIDQPQGEQFEEIGNPQLKHTRADNLDLRYELFPGLTDQLLIGTFYKKLVNPMEYFVVRDASPSALYLKPQNVNQATNFGAELVFTKYWGKFGVSLNYTYTHSLITTPKVVYQYVTGANNYSADTSFAVNQSRPLQGQADHVGNFALLYKDPVFGLDIQLAFQYTGNRIVQVSPYYNLDIWQKPIDQLDLSFEKRIVRRLYFYAKVNNLTDSKPKEYIKQSYKYTDYNFGTSGYTVPFQTGSSYTTTQIDIYRLNFLAGFRYKF
jgi:TonB-dependent receptor